LKDSALEKCSLFSDIPAKELRENLETVPHHIQYYAKGETIFEIMEPANRIAIILEGRVQAQKPFPNGSQINFSARLPGEIIGPAAVFSKSKRYPCDVIALEPATLMVFQEHDILLLLQQDIRILKHFITELASATYLLQQRLELLSYTGIAQKIAYYLLIQAKQLESNAVPIPDSVSNWALILHVSRTSLHRELKNMQTGGLLSYQPPVINIKNTAALEQLLSK
jgi:CRP-like cAMP-binding protein